MTKSHQQILDRANKFMKDRKKGKKGDDERKKVQKDDRTEENSVSVRKKLKREKRKFREKKNKPQISKKKNTETAILYLHQWKNNKDQWKFQKLLQVWLLQNMLNNEMISDDDFPLLVEYIGSVKGASRQRTMSRAKDLVELRDRWKEMKREGKSKEEIKEQLKKDKPKRDEYKRARTLLQCLDEEVV